MPDPLRDTRAGEVGPVRARRNP